MTAYTLRINGEEHTVDVESGTPLLWVLRDTLGLTGTKYGCGIGGCGSCTVHLDGEAIRSCTTTIGEAADHEIATIEGLSGDVSHPLQQAWIDEHISQCGYCQPGQIMQAAALLAAEKAGWGSPLPEGWGRGIACHSTFDMTPVVHVVELSLNDDNSLRIQRVVCAIDCGLPVNPGRAISAITACYTSTKCPSSRCIFCPASAPQRHRRDGCAAHCARRRQCLIRADRSTRPPTAHRHGGAQSGLNPAFQNRPIKDIRQMAAGHLFRRLPDRKFSEIYKQFIKLTPESFYLCYINVK